MAERPSATMLEAIRKVAGTDTVLIARRRQPDLTKMAADITREEGWR